jgi:hypothetical protein
MREAILAAARGAEAHRSSAPARGCGAQALLRSRLRPVVCLLVCALAAWSCRSGEETIQLTLTSGAERLSQLEVRVLVENPPGGIIPRRTDAEGRIRLPSALRGRRVQIGLDCDGNACHKVSPPRRIERDAMTFDVSGGLNLNPPQQ